MASALWSCWELKLGAPPDGAPFLLFSPDFDGDTAQYVQIVPAWERRRSWQRCGQQTAPRRFTPTGADLIP